MNKKCVFSRFPGYICLALMLTPLFIFASGPVIKMKTYNHNPNLIEELRVRNGLPNAFKKLNSRQRVCVAYLGGSITEAEGWRPKTFSWLQSRFPHADLVRVDAAVPGTGADFAAARLGSDVLSQNPDLVFIEFRVNCGGGVEARAIEGTIRQLWDANPKTDICLVYTIAEWMIEDMENGGKQYFFGKIMEEIANVYGIPSIDLAPEVLKRKNAGTLVFKAPQAMEGKLVFSKDGVHPGDAGHEVYTEVVSRALVAMMGQGTEGRHLLPPPMEAQHLERAMFMPVSIAQTSAEWHPVNPQRDVIYSRDTFRTRQMLKDAILCREEGASMTVNWSGTRLSLTHIPQGKGMEILVSTDGLAAVPYTFEQNSDELLYAQFTNLPELPQGEHTTTLTIRKLPGDTVFYLGQFLVLQDPEGTDS